MVLSLFCESLQLIWMNYVKGSFDSVNSLIYRLLGKKPIFRYIHWKELLPNAHLK